MSVLSIIDGEAADIQSHLETIEETIDEQGSSLSITVAVQQLRQALDELNEAIEEEESD